MHTFFGHNEDRTRYSADRVFHPIVLEACLPDGRLGLRVSVLGLMQNIAGSKFKPLECLAWYKVCRCFHPTYLSASLGADCRWFQTQVISLFVLAHAQIVAGSKLN